MGSSTPGEYQRAANKSHSVTENAFMNVSASSRGVGGGLLLGFSDCEVGGAAGQVYVAAQHRLRGVHCETDKMYWHFEPIAGTQFGTTDVITMDVDDANQPKIWRLIQSYIGGSKVGSVLVWIHNPCAIGADGKPISLPGVDAIAISIASSS